MSRLQDVLKGYLAAFIVLFVVGLCAAFILTGTRSEDGSITLDGKNAKYSQSEKDALCKLKQIRDDAVLGLLGVNVPQDAASGCDPVDIAQMGASVYYGVDVSTPQAFYNAVNGRGFNEGYGLQCVAGFKEFMYALSGKYVATKSGGANGYAQQQAQIEPLGFKWHNGAAGLQDGDWAIFSGGQYGHVAMKYQGKWFGQNQGAVSATAGNAFNLLAFGTENVIGYYRPNIYQKAVSSPANASSTSSDNSVSVGPNDGSYVVKRGDTLGDIALSNGWYRGNGSLYGDSGYAQELADKNGIGWRGLIYPGQAIHR